MKTLNQKFYLKLKMTILVISSALLMTSCEDQLMEKPLNFYNTNQSFENTDKLRMIVNGVYEVFSDLSTYGQNWMVYDCDTDISHISGSSLGHVARDLGHYNIYVTHIWLQDSWQLYYQGIDRANTILENAEKVAIKDEADRKLFNTLLAETRALRAMCYFDLVLLYGDVPLKKTASQSEDNYNVKRTDRNLIFDYIEEDLKAAIEVLEYAQDQTGGYNGRLNKGAAIGLLARVNLFRAGYFLGQNGQMQRYPNYKDYYQNVITLTDELINSNKHRLLDSYEQVFRNMCELKLDPTENIWEIPFFNSSGDRKHSSNMGTYNGPSIPEGSIYGRANSFIKTHNFFYDIYETDDLRKDVAVATFGINTSNQINQINRNQSYNWAPGKWRRNWQTGEIKDNNNTDVNWVLIRYADILLMRAEAENEVNGVTSTAVEYLNQIRRRAHGLPYRNSEVTVDKTIADFASPDAFRAEIVDERARELCFEGLRRQDLIRWNLLETKIKDTNNQIKQAIADGKLRSFTFTAAERFTPNKHELYPIPDYDIRESKGALIQNPNYQVTN